MVIVSIGKCAATDSRRVFALVRSGADCKLVTDAAIQMFTKQANEERVSEVCQRWIGKSSAFVKRSRATRVGEP